MINRKFYVFFFYYNVACVGGHHMIALLMLSDDFNLPVIKANIPYAEIRKGNITQINVVL